MQSTSISIGEVALSLILLVCVGLLAETLFRLSHVDHGFKTHLESGSIQSL